ncbi:hypothetical protein KGM_203058 [Danaus plexippus plexippus]|uniref:Uncharacterized protein n=1 Tax=Danaus plexippus plexippus TaxID=278856 RepID=A0A212FDJ6_DANPL|nr:hypothetical protein KGM_203058 [Danaus plexippus plexippus]
MLLIYVNSHQHGSSSTMALLQEPGRQHNLHRGILSTCHQSTDYLRWTALPSMYMPEHHIYSTVSVSVSVSLPPTLSPTLPGSLPPTMPPAMSLP